jgi:Zn-dependent protease with chaperone function
MVSNNLSKSSRPGIGGIKNHVLPLLLTFVIPGFALWFFTHAESKIDDEIRRSLVAEVDASTNLSPEERKAASEFYRTIEVSRVMASSDPSLIELQNMFEPTKLRYANFRWGKRISLACLGSSIFALVFVAAGVAWLCRSQEALYFSLRVGWPMLRIIAALQVLGQGLLAVALSFWVTALWMEMYVPQLIVICALLAFGGVVLIYKAMLAKTDSRFDQMGELLLEEMAPTLWARVREIASRLGTKAPDNIIVGIDAKFYVTEHDIRLKDRQIFGRSLFISLPLLKVLDVEQADAILGHEMAHFSGEDTMWSRKIGPLLQQMEIYLAHLAQGVLSIPVFCFLHFFWKLYQFSFGKMSRAREFRADRIGAETSSPAALAGSLVRLTAYCEYRSKTEEDIMLREGTASRPEIALRLEQGFPIFLSGFAKNPKSALSEISHPFDTHPQLRDRIQALGFTMAGICADSTLQAQVLRSWCDSISDAASIEERMWSQQEQLMMNVREINRSMSIIPESEEDLQLLVKHFPEKTFTNAEGKIATLDHISVKLQDWQEAVQFDQIVIMELEDIMGKKMLHSTYRPDNSKETKTHKFRPEVFLFQNENLLDAFNFYYSRHKNAEAKNQK